MNQPLWMPSPSFQRQTHLTHYREWLNTHKALNFPDYESLHQWSVTHTEVFWESLWEYFDIISHTPYTSVLSSHHMPGAQWFEGSTLNYAEHIFRQLTDSHPAILYQSEGEPLREMSWQELHGRVPSLGAWLRTPGVRPGDRIAGVLPNVPEATIAFLAACSIGAIWSSCSPDFGAGSVVDRFQQIEPKVLIATDGYRYGGKAYSKMEAVTEICSELPSLEKVVLIPWLDAKASPAALPRGCLWDETQQQLGASLTFEALPFSHPIWILYSSGTTGAPKAITHSHGGVLLEHLKYLAFHNDVHPGERFFWFSTTGWMMWNFVQASLLMGATIVLYEGSPGFPDLNVLWRMAEEGRINHFGTSAPFLVACMKNGLKPGTAYDLGPLRSIGSTGSPLPPEAFEWVYQAVKKDLWLCSMSGGTDVCTAFVGGCPVEPVYEGEIQCRALGCALEAWDEQGHPVVDELGEMVITRPMPSMPVFFWNDPENERYRTSYFQMYPDVWRHGDWIRITPHHSLVIYGRSDATLNRQGVRIGTAEIYRTLNKIPEVRESLIVNLELSGGRHYMPLFVQMSTGESLTDALASRIKAQLRSECSPRHVPDDIIEVPDIPFTISGKKLEAPVKKILLGMHPGNAANPDAMRNPESLTFFINFSKSIDV
ncbi:MAG: acetoacetate--CoA ligase [Saprospiraceae bacterium]